MKRQIPRLLALIANLAVAGMALYGTATAARHSGWSILKYYTQLSNLFGALACLVIAGFEIKSICAKREKTPAWAYCIQFSAVCCLMVTFLVVLFVLAPDAGKNGYRTMLTQGDMLYHHLLCPILILVAFALLERPNIPMRAAAYAVIPTLIYGIVTLILNLARKLDGPYPFLQIYRQPAIASVGWFVAIIGGNYLIALAVGAVSKPRRI